MKSTIHVSWKMTPTRMVTSGIALERGRRPKDVSSPYMSQNSSPRSNECTSNVHVLRESGLEAHSITVENTSFRSNRMCCISRDCHVFIMLAWNLVELQVTRKESQCRTGCRLLPEAPMLSQQERLTSSPNRRPYLISSLTFPLDVSAPSANPAVLDARQLASLCNAREDAAPASAAALVGNCIWIVMRRSAFKMNYRQNAGTGPRGVK